MMLFSEILLLLSRTSRGFSKDNLLEALFSSLQKPKKFQDSSSHRILRHMHKALNIGESNNESNFGPSKRFFFF